MIAVFNGLSFLFAWAYALVFFIILRTFLPMRKPLPLQLFAFVICGYLSDAIIYSNDLAGLFGTMLGFFIYVLVFYHGTLMEKVSVVLVFYPALIAINYLMLDTGGRLFKMLTGATYDDTMHSSQLLLTSTALHTFTVFLRLLFWVLAWFILRRFLAKIASHLNARTWLIIDMLMMASFVAIFTIIYFMPEDTGIVYPICGAAIFSSFGCMYLASYIYGSMQTAHRAQAMATQLDYVQARIQDEARVRSIYHDLKNHLLLFENGGSGDTQAMAKTLRAQIEGYEDYQHTGNEFLDVILRDKAQQARAKHIDFHAMVRFEAGDFIAPLDVSTIFGNALDNAIEASEKLPEEERLITIKAGTSHGMLVIRVENNMAEEGLPVGAATTKNDVFLHGFGLTNIRRAVENYDGELSVKAENGVFRLSAVMPLPDMDGQREFAFHRNLT